MVICPWIQGISPFGPAWLVHDPGILEPGCSVAPAESSSLNHCGNSSSNSISSEGYYLLMVPSGVHTLQARATCYLQSSVPNVAVSAGQSVTLNISIEPDPDGCGGNNNNGGCPASNLLSEKNSSGSLELLRLFRDRVLHSTKPGKKLINLYYSLGNDIWAVVKKDPALRKRGVKLLRKFMPFVYKSLANAESKLAPDLLSDVSSFLFDVEMASDPPVTSKINRLRREMRSFKIKKLFKK